MTIKSIIATTLLAAGVALAIAPARAEAPMHKRIQHQRQRIHQGVRSGSLTPREARRLRRHERMLAMRTRHARMTGGRMTGREHRRLERAANRQSRRIYRLKHNDQNR